MYSKYIYTHIFNIIIIWYKKLFFPEEICRCSFQNLNGEIVLLKLRMFRPFRHSQNEKKLLNPNTFFLFFENKENRSNKERITHAIFVSSLSNCISLYQKVLCKSRSSNRQVNLCYFY